MDRVRRVRGLCDAGAIADLIRPALDPLTSPGTIIAMIYFFIVGYVTIAILFLAIGAMSDSMRDAQGYLMPVIWSSCFRSRS